MAPLKIIEKAAHYMARDLKRSDLRTELEYEKIVSTEKFTQIWQLCEENVCPPSGIRRTLFGQWDENETFTEHGVSDFLETEIGIPASLRKLLFAALFQSTVWGTHIRDCPLLLYAVNTTSQGATTVDHNEVPVSRNVENTFESHYDRILLESWKLFSNNFLELARLNSNERMETAKTTFSGVADLAKITSNGVVELAKITADERRKSEKRYHDLIMKILEALLQPGTPKSAVEACMKQEKDGIVKSVDDTLRAVKIKNDATITWEKYFSEDEAIVAANKDWAGVDEIIVYGKDEDDCAMHLSAAPDLLLIVASSGSTFQVFHHVQEIGGTRLHRDRHLVAFHNFGPVARAVLLPKKALFKNLSYEIPKRDDLYNSVEKADDFFALPASGEVFKGKHCIVLPSILAAEFAKSTSVLPGDLLRPISDILAAHDKNLLDHRRRVLSQSAFKDIFAFFWGIYHGKVPPIRAVDTEDSFVLKWKSDLHHSCLSPPFHPGVHNSTVETDANHQPVEVATVVAKGEDKNIEEIGTTLDSKKKFARASSKKVDVEATSESLMVDVERKHCRSAGCDEKISTENVQHNDPKPDAEAVTESNNMATVSNMTHCHFVGCKKKFPCIECARSHMMNDHNNEDEGFFLCPVKDENHKKTGCNTWESYHEHFQRRTQTRNGCPANVLYIRNEADAGEVAQSNMKRFHCVECDKEYATIAALRRHLTTADHMEGTVKCPACGRETKIKKEEE